MTRAVALALAGLLITALGCSKPVEPAAKARRNIPPPSPTKLYGGDARAWSGTLGDMEDSNYCRAKLKLPLSEAKSWQFEYTSAAFSGNAPTTVLNYDGTLVVSANSPQLLQLDATDGEDLVNRDVYERGRFASDNQRELFGSLFISPAGRLLVNDNRSRTYCFAMAGLERLWSVNNGIFGDAEASEALVVDDTRVYTSWGIPRADNLYALDVESGEQNWMYPYAAEAMSGVTLSRSGTMLCYAAPCEIRAVNAADGHPIWTLTASAPIHLAPIDEPRQTVHLLLRNETLECRSLEDGARLWSYDWSGVLPLAERRRMAEAAGLTELGITEHTIEAQLTGYGIGKDASYLSTTSGHITRLSPQGKAVWTTKLDSYVSNIVVFDNALLAIQDYSYPERSAPRQIDPFNLVPPKWSKPTPHNAKAAPKGKIAQRRSWCRIAALDLHSGAMLSSVEPETLADSNLCPAGTRIVFGGAPNGSTPGSAVHYITAYNWLEP